MRFWSSHFYQTRESWNFASGKKKSEKVVIFLVIYTFRMYEIEHARIVCFNVWKFKSFYVLTKQMANVLCSDRVCGMELPVFLITVQTKESPSGSQTSIFRVWCACVCVCVCVYRAHTACSTFCQLTSSAENSGTVIKLIITTSFREHCHTVWGNIRERKKSRVNAQVRVCRVREREMGGYALISRREYIRFDID